MLTYLLNTSDCALERKCLKNLLLKGENITDSPHEKIMILKNPISHGWNNILAESEKIVEISQSYDSELIKKKLIELVPEYLPDSSLNLKLYRK